MSSFSINIDLLPINITIYKEENNNFILTTFNKTAESVEPSTSTDSLGCKITECIANVRASGLFDILKKVSLTGKAEEIIIPIYEEGKKKWLQHKVIKLPDDTLAIFSNYFYPDNSNLEIRGYELEQELNESAKLLEHQKKMFQHIMENSEAISVQGYNENHEVIYWNKASEKIYGYTANEAYGKKLELLIIPKPMRQVVHDTIESWLYNEISPPSSELTLIDKHGNDVNVFSQHIMIKVDTNHYEMYCVDIDLREIKHLQKELLTQRNFLRTVFNVIPDLIWIQDIEDKYLACNTTFERFIGAKEAEIMGQPVQELTDSETASLFSIPEISQHNSNTSNDYLIFAGNSHKGFFETVKMPVVDENGTMLGTLGVSRDITEQKEREQKLQKYAHFDTLTGLANRTLFMDKLRKITQQQKNRFNSAILFIDLDHFKEINDTRGHSIGDQVLIIVAQRLTSIIRKEDSLARFGGDEFTILLEQIDSPIDAMGVANAILDVLREPLVIDHLHFHLTTSIGITIFPDDGVDPESLLRFADTAMYKAKENGRNNFEFYTKDLSNQAFDRVLLESNLRRAINNNEFIIYYQPQLDAISQKVIGAEALIRWNDPQLGIITPYKFIAAAESSGQITEIGRWVLHQVMKDMGYWRKNGIALETVSINLSVKQLNDKTLLTSISETLKKTECNPEWIEFEVTEGYAMNEPEQAIILLENIRDLGCKISIDDFGTGYSSLAYLKRLPVKKLKIDQSFVRDIPGDNNDEAIVKAVILIAKSMQLEVIAEGVETKMQQAFLLSHGCRYSQGYLYARPMPKEQFEEYLETY